MRALPGKNGLCNAALWAMRPRRYCGVNGFFHPPGARAFSGNALDR